MPQCTMPTGIDWHNIVLGKPIQNAIIEAFNSKLLDECLKENQFSLLTEAPIRSRPGASIATLFDCIARSATNRRRRSPRPAHPRCNGARRCTIRPRGAHLRSTGCVGEPISQSTFAISSSEAAQQDPSCSGILMAYRPLGAASDSV